MARMKQLYDYREEDVPCTLLEPWKIVTLLHGVSTPDVKLRLLGRALDRLRTFVLTAGGSVMGGKMKVLTQRWEEMDAKCRQSRFPDQEARRMSTRINRLHHDMAKDLRLILAAMEDGPEQNQHAAAMFRT